MENVNKAFELMEKCLGYSDDCPKIVGVIKSNYLLNEENVLKVLHNLLDAIEFDQDGKYKSRDRSLNKIDKILKKC